MSEFNKKIKGLLRERNKALVWIIADAAFLNAAVLISLVIRYDLSVKEIPDTAIQNYISYIPFFAVSSFLIFAIFRLYSCLWRFASVKEAFFILAACLFLSVTHAAGSFAAGLALPVSVYFISCMLFSAFTLMSRFFLRLLEIYRKISRDIHSSQDGLANIMIIGAGSAGNMLIKEIKSSVFLCSNRVACVIDDDPAKKGQYIQGAHIIGGRSNISGAVKKYEIDQIIFAIPSADTKDKKDILELCSRTGCEILVLPSVYQLINGRAGLSNLRSIEIEDLLGREPISMKPKDIETFIKGKTVLITGGGGSIGSELCRQIACYRPAGLVILDISENNLYDIQQEMNVTHPEIAFNFLVGSVRDEKRVNAVFERYRPDVVYHAAAHKHVPMMEANPNEAVKNNVFGTLITVRAAIRWNAQRFVLISTDKAVNPTNIMGATKRICEMIIQAYSKTSGTELVAVRFGNVLNSNGSVIPLFRKQIKAGGPVTVTHPEITRYFMTIPEAVSLVLQAGAFARGGEIFILDMGEPVKIAELARKLIYLSGYTPGEQIKIMYTGLRPGEKLYEELLMEEEGLKATENALIHIGRPIRFNEERFFFSLERLQTAMYDEGSDIHGLIKSMVPTYFHKENHTSETIKTEAKAVKASTVLTT